MIPAPTSEELEFFAAAGIEWDIADQRFWVCQLTYKNMVTEMWVGLMMDGSWSCVCRQWTGQQWQKFESPRFDSPITAFIFGQVEGWEPSWPTK